MSTDAVTLTSNEKEILHTEKTEEDDAKSEGDQKQNENIESRDVQPLETKTPPLDTNNPGLVIIPAQFEGKTFHVIRDDELEAGTKQRALISWLKKEEGEEFVYAGPVFGYAQIALALAAKLNGKKGTLFLEERRPRHPLTQKAESLGANIIELRPRAPLKEVQKAATDYVEQRKDKGTVLLPFGLHSPEFIGLLADRLRDAIGLSHPKLLKMPPARLWLVVGSATILAALHRVWPDTHFLCVQVGMKIWDDLVEGKKHTIYVAPEKFTETSLRLPPYPSVRTYDAKLWQFVEDHGQDGDYIWNVGKDVDSPSPQMGGKHRDKRSDSRHHPYGRTNRESRQERFGQLMTDVDIEDLTSILSMIQPEVLIEVSNDMDTQRWNVVEIEQNSGQSTAEISIVTQGENCAYVSDFRGILCIKFGV
ncbi:hypothetical protein PROFUN_11463 [Planoprotostelium fungivorum]|uniref:Uncharacterized protein n=1 Tax=Planoprotostelium fungivorum TaxID=1890364 RepID=A0A2P6N4X7_9EUKA|nr:hypothetical protein PROFUN_11463 [Planoprotostelium fungivorum]